MSFAFCRRGPLFEGLAAGEYLEGRYVDDPPGPIGVVASSRRGISACDGGSKLAPAAAGNCVVIKPSWKSRR